MVSASSARVRRIGNAVESGSLGIAGPADVTPIVEIGRLGPAALGDLCSKRVQVGVAMFGEQLSQIVLPSPLARRHSSDTDTIVGISPLSFCAPSLWIGSSMERTYQERP
jgi:hypothetical protein